jgi:hypothetical protein
VTVVPEPAAELPSTAELPSAAERPSTGHPEVDAALAELDVATELAPAQQVAAYEQAHRALSQTLATIDQS